ncbi:MAG: hypothetical protein ABSF69_22925 [Polyangiaceae bacterium]|jgi:hypothetical protein
MSTSKKKPMPALAPLDMAAFNAAAVVIPDPVQSVIAPQSPPPVPASPSKRGKAHAIANGSSTPQPSRAGKAQLSVWVRIEKRKALKRRALDIGRAVDDIVNELIDDFLKRQ